MRSFLHLVLGGGDLTRDSGKRLRSNAAELGS